MWNLSLLGDVMSIIGTIVTVFTFIPWGMFQAFENPCLLHLTYFQLFSLNDILCDPHDHPMGVSQLNKYLLN